MVSRAVVVVVIGGATTHCGISDTIVAMPASGVTLTWHVVAPDAKGRPFAVSSITWRVTGTATRLFVVADAANTGAVVTIGVTAVTVVCTRAGAARSGTAITTAAGLAAAVAT